LALFAADPAGDHRAGIKSSANYLKGNRKMKLYYSPGSCSLASHISLLEAGISPDLVKVDLWKHQLEDGSDYRLINPKGAVPALELEEDGILTEGSAVLQYIGDHYAPALVPAAGAITRARLHEILNYLASEYHKSYNPLFYLSPDADRTEAQKPVIARLTYLNSVLANGGPYLLGDKLTVADFYLFAVTRWAANFDISLEAFPALKAFMALIEARPAVHKAMAAEGLLEA